MHKTVLTYHYEDISDEEMKTLTESFNALPLRNICTKGIPLQGCTDIEAPSAPVSGIHLTSTMPHTLATNTPTTDLQSITISPQNPWTYFQASFERIFFSDKKY